jgi:short-subunit dehydrogenase
MRDSVAIITGASSGIGRETALALAAKGVHVALTARSAGRLAQLEQEIRAGGGSVFVRTADVTDMAQMASLAEETRRRYGRIDFIVCNAGEYVRGPVRSLTTGDFQRAMAVNFYGALNLVYAVLPVMLAQGSGHIVAVSSVDGKKGLPLDAAYVSSKFALTGFMDVLRQELHGTGVYASTILPGRVDTPMIEHLRVPLISAKISSRRVARSILRAVRRRKAEIIVPAGGPRLLVIMNALFPAAADWLVRVFRLEGREQPTMDQEQILKNA